MIEIKCKYCKKQFKTNKLNREFCSRNCVNEYRKEQTKLKYTKNCPICNKKFSGINKTCSIDCANKLKEQTMISRYGVSNPSQNLEIKNKISNALKNRTIEEKQQTQNKMKQTMINRYGVEHAFQSNQIKNKMKQTMIDRYGVDNPMKSNQIKNKVKQTNLEKYGNEILFKTNNFKEKSKQKCFKKYGLEYFSQVPIIQDKIKQTNFKKYNVNNPMKSNQIKNKMKQTMIDRYGVDNPMKSNQIKNKVKQTNLEKYGVPYICMTKQCRESNPFIISKVNQSFSKFFNNNGYKTELEFSINKFSYDIHILNTNILIEIDPAYTHNSTIGPVFNNKVLEAKDKYYHYNKTKLALENGYICIHKFNWISKEQMLKIIKNISKYNFFSQNEPRLHWYNMKTKKHILDNNFNKNDMLKNGFVEIYDDGLMF